MATSNVRAAAKKHSLLILVILLVLLLTGGYLLGFRPGPALTVVRSGTLTFTNLPAGATVYADEAKRVVSKGGDTRMSLVPGSHTIIVDVPGDYPWSDVISVRGSHDTRIAAILVPTRMQPTYFEPADRTKAAALIKAATLPTMLAPLALEQGCALVSVSDNRIIASGTTTPDCTPPSYLCVGGSCSDTVIFSPVAPIHSVLAYPGRQDALIISYGDTLAVLELNPLTPQYFAPLYKGIAPLAAAWDATSTIAVSDDRSTFKLTF